MIDSMRLRNFKAFRELELRLRPLTLLTGVNAAGKSTIIQSLALVRQSYDEGVLDAGGGFLLNGSLVELGVGQDVLHEDYTDGRGDAPIPIGIGCTVGSRDLWWQAEYETSRDREADLLRFAAGQPLPDSAQDGAGGLLGSGFQFLKADRIVPAVHYPKSYQAVIRRGSLGARGEHTVNFLRARRDDPVAALPVRHPKAKSTGLLDQVEAWLQTVCPGVNLMAEDVRGTDFVKLSYGFGGTAGIGSSNIRYRPTNVGFGLTYALPIIVACISAGPSSLIMLENPEAHLHPRGQTAMARLAALAVAAGAQVLIESHSDHILNGIRLAVKESVVGPDGVALHYFDRDDHGKIETSSPQIDVDGMLSRWPIGFFDEWDRALDRLLD